MVYIHPRILTWGCIDCYGAGTVLRDLVPAEDEAPIEACITEVASAPPPPPSFLPSLIQPLRTRAAMAQMRAAAPSTYHLLSMQGPPHCYLYHYLHHPLARADILEADMRLRRGPTMARRVDCSSVDTMETRVRDTERRMMAALEVVNLRMDRAAIRVRFEYLRREILAYEQESMETRQALARSEAYSRALEARVTVLETQGVARWRSIGRDDRRGISCCIRLWVAGCSDDTLEDMVVSA
ncbi:hypothetical protein Tco_0352011 [Tanacetum coccineum]